MDKEILLEYSNVQDEIKSLRCRIAELEDDIRRLEKSEVSDSVSCGKKGGKPLRTVRVTGIPDAKIERKYMTIRTKKALLEAREAELLEMSVQVEEYIGSMKKSELRRYSAITL